MRAFAFGMLIAICCLYLAFDSQKPPTFRIVKVKNGKKISNTTTVPSYFYDDTVNYCICFLICFIISLSSMSDFSTLYLSSFHIPLSVNCSQLSLSLFVLVVGPPRLCVGHGLMDRWIALNSHSL